MNGGDGGNGTNGGKGGRGGFVTITVAERDMDLLALVDRVNVQGGRGGLPGSNGLGGKGGIGGKNGRTK